MKAFVKILLFGGLASLVLLLAAPATSNAFPPQPFYGKYVQRHGAYEGWQSYPQYFFGPGYYGPGTQIYRFRPRYDDYDYDYYNLRPRGPVLVGPPGQW